MGGDRQGIGTITVRFLMDDLRADNNGFPTGDDVLTVEAYINTMRPVAIKDCFVEAPVPEPINFTIFEMIEDTDLVRAGIEVSVADMLRIKRGSRAFGKWSDGARNDDLRCMGFRSHHRGGRRHEFHADYG